MKLLIYSATGTPSAWWNAIWQFSGISGLVLMAEALKWLSH